MLSMGRVMTTHTCKRKNNASAFEPIVMAALERCALKTLAEAADSDVLSLLENMAFFTDPQGGVHHPFGQTQLKRSS